MEQNLNDTKKLLKSSVDYTICKNGLILYGVLLLFASFLWVGIALLTQSARFLWGLLPLFLLYLLYACRQIIKMADILKAPEQCLISESVLTNPQPCFSATVCFTVTVRNAQNQLLELESGAIGRTRGSLRQHFSDLNNKRVLVSYNPLTGQVVVLKVFS